MAIWITPEEVLARWISGAKPLADSTTLLTVIEDAEDAVLEVYPGIQERIDNNELPLNRLKRVIAGVVIRSFKIGQEYRTNFSESTGPFSHSVSMNAEAPRSVALTDEEIRTLAPYRSGGAFSISMAPRMHSGNGADIWHTVDTLNGLP